MPWGQIVVGPPGSGKTTYCAGVAQFLAAAPLALRRRTVVVNLDPANHARHSREIQGTIRYFHAIPYDGYFIWGATAGMLMNLYEVLTDA